ncbi:MAG: hypothetical protein HXX11_03505 [Desulfuromonadales bacterium]|nr:hypothetical protein [Desulfuromonadales bacterium]
MGNIAQFKRICGNCEELDICAITDADVRMQALEWSHSDEATPSEGDIEDAILGLHELQELRRQNSDYTQ